MAFGTAVHDSVTGEATVALFAGAVRLGPCVGQTVGFCVATVTVAELLFGFGSVAELVAEAVLENAPRTPWSTWYFDVIATDAPAASVPRLQGYGVVQPPLLERNVVPTGVGSLTTTFCAAFGPPLETTIVNVATVFSGAFVGPRFVTLRSAVSVPESDVVAVETLFVALASKVELLTVAVLELVVPAKFGGTLYVVVITAICDGLSVPRAHGYVPVQAPLFPTNVRPVGVGSSTKTFAAASGPLFLTVTV